MRNYLNNLFRLVIVLLCSFKAYSQDNVLDSLKKVLQIEKDDTSKVNTLIEISINLNNYKQSKPYADEALLLANKLNNIKGQGRAYGEIGWLYYYQHNDSAALRNFFIAMKIRKEINDQDGLMKSLISIGDVYQREGNLPEAIKYNQAALEIIKKYRTKDDILSQYYAISRLYNAEHNYTEALNNMNNALELVKKTGDKSAIAGAYSYIGYVYGDQNNKAGYLKNMYISLKLNEQLGNKAQIGLMLQYIGNAYQGMDDDSDAIKTLLQSAKIREQISDKEGLGVTYSSMGNIYTEEGKYPEALEKEYAALKLFQQPGMPVWGKAICHGSIGLIYERQGDAALLSGDKVNATIKFAEAEKNYLSELKEREETNELEAIAGCYSALGSIKIKLKNYSAAKDYLDTSLKMSLAFNDRRTLKNVYESLSRLDTLNGNYKLAYKNYTKSVLYRDSITSDENSQNSLQLKMQYDFNKKEAIAKEEQAKKDAEAKRLKTLQYFTIAALGVAMLAVLIIAFIQWRYNKQKQQANLLLHQQKEKVESTLSELKSTQAQLIQSEKMASLGELTAGIAHEIQNPLNFVNNFSEVNKEMIDEATEEIDKGNVSEVKNILNNIKDNEEKINHHGKRADAIVKGMLQHSRQTKGVKEPTDINALCDEYLRLSYHGLRAKDKSFNAVLHTDFDENIGKINAVSQDIGRVLLNLFNNAFYAVNEKKKTSHSLKGEPEYEPTVLVRTKLLSSTLGDGDKIEIAVKDNGNGIPQKVLDKIFQPFFTTKPTGQGTGLGLSLSYDIIKAHGGEIKVETKEARPNNELGQPLADGHGEGSEFIIELPVK